MISQSLAPPRILQRLGVAASLRYAFVDAPANGVTVSARPVTAVLQRTKQSIVGQGGGGVSHEHRRPVPERRVAGV